MTQGSEALTENFLTNHVVLSSKGVAPLRGAALLHLLVLDQKERILRDRFGRDFDHSRAREQ